MAYEIYFPSGCDTAVGDHLCSDCPTPELGRVRSVAFIKDTFEFIDPTDPTEWDTGIGNKDIIIIPATNGSFDGGSEVEGTGYGDQATKLIGYNFALTFNDPNYKTNATFYNAIKRSRNYRVAYRTETQTHLSTKTVSVVPKNPVAEDITSEVVWNVLVKWAEEDLPIPYDTPEGIFTCFAYTGEPTAPTTFDTELEFSADVSDSGAGVAATVSGTDADLLFEFNAIDPIVDPTANLMSIEVSDVEVIAVTFPADYSGEAFRFTDAAGVAHTGVFTNGTVNF